MKRIVFDSLTLAAVTDGLQFLCGGRIQRIVQTGAQEVVFSVYAPGHGQTHWLFNCSGQWFRTHTISQRPGKAVSTPVPSSGAPPAFCMALRKYLDGGKILSIRQRGFDRILDVQVRGHEAETYIFSAELMGRNSNLLLVGPDATVLHAARFSPPHTQRPILPGRSYAPPPTGSRPDPRTTEDNTFLQACEAAAPPDFAQWLGTHFEGISRLLAQEIAARCRDETPEARRQAFDEVMMAAREHQWQPVLSSDEFGSVGAYPMRLQSTPHWRQEPRHDINTALEEHFAAAVPGARIEDERRTLETTLRRLLGAKTHALEQISAGVQESERAGEYRKWGESVLANLYQIRKGEDAVELPDYYSDPPATMRVPLDPTLSPSENAERFFVRARHITDNAARLEELQQSRAREKAELEAILKHVAAAANLEELRELRALAAEHGWITENHSLTSAKTQSKTTQPQFDGKKVRSFLSPDGWTVLVGENAEANDYLIQRVAAPDDWWLHVRAHASAHVIIRTNKEPQRVPPSTLFFAARLAAQRSAAKHSGGVDVDYTLRKYVRRPRNAAPGQVLRTHEKTLHVVPGE